MRTNKAIATITVVALAVTLGGMVMLKRPSQVLHPPGTPSPSPVEKPPAPVQAAAAVPRETVMPVESVSTNLVAVAEPRKKKAKTKHAAKEKAPIQDPVARMALSLVGADPEAELYWMSAINDPTLPAEERQDLIEDLNEDGLSDPHHPAPEDMPLIASRLALIQELAPSAMDQVNAAAFQEAAKDLANLLAGNAAQ